jgi:hypothetical protein
MPYYKDINLLFIHIPKTGGTNIENNIKNKYLESLFTIHDSNKIVENFKLNAPIYDIINHQHLFYETIYEYRDYFKLDFNNIKVFTIVRNPYDRIISDLFWFNLIQKDTSPEDVYEKINFFINHKITDNHNQAQYKFITDKYGKLLDNIKIFKTEEIN